MIQELIRIKTSDGINMPGIIYRPICESDKLVIHIHGLAGSFYEEFVSSLAKAYTNLGYSFLAFNNRGSGYVTTIIKENNDGVNRCIGGSSHELFDESILDIDCVIEWAQKNNYKNIVLEGHSYGCNKVINYYSKTNNEVIKKIVLLAPCDVVEEPKIKLGNKYKEVVGFAQEMINKNEGDKLLMSPLYPLTFTAKTFINGFYENCHADIFRYREKEHLSNILTNIQIPILVIIGDNDKTAYSQDKQIVQAFLKNNIKNLQFIGIEDCGHVYKNKENDLINIINKEFNK